MTKVLQLYAKEDLHSDIKQLKQLCEAQQNRVDVLAEMEILNKQIKKKTFDIRQALDVKMLKFYNGKSP